MKALNRKSLVVLVLSFIFALSMLAFAGMVKPAKAEVEPITVKTFELMDEASVRIGADATVKGSGIRFRARIDADTYNALIADETVGAYMGFIITPKYYYNKAVNEGVTDWLSGVDKYVSQDKGGVIVDESKIYPEDGYYYANGALNNINANNINLEFTAIAFIYDGVETHYSVPSVDFARTYTQVIQKAFIDGYDVKELKKADHMADTDAETPGFISQMQSGAVTVAIETAEDLYNLSDSVANNKAFANSVFEIKGDLVVDHDFAPIDCDIFGGKIISNDAHTVTVYNNRALTSILSNEVVANLTYNVSQELFDMTDKAGALLTYRAPSADYVGKTVAFEDAPDVANFIGFNQPSAVVPVHVNGTTLKLAVNYTATDLANYRDDYQVQEEGKELAVKFTYMVEGADARNNYGLNLLQAGGHGNAESGMYNVPENRWMTAYARIDDVIAAYSGEKLNIFQTFSEDNENIYNFYIGGIEFAEWDFTNGIVLNYNYDLTAQDFYDRHSVSSSTTVEVISASQCADEITSGDYHKYLHNAINYTGDAFVASTSSSARGLEFNMPYTGAQYAQIAELLKPADENKEIGVEVIYRASTIGSTSYETGTLGTRLAKEGADRWQTAVLPVSDFVNTFGNMVKPSEDASNATVFETDLTSKNLVVRPEAWMSGKWEFCIASIKLIEWDFETQVANKGDLGYTPSERTKSYYTGYGTSAYYTNDELPEGMNNLIGFNGGAVGITGIGNAKSVYIEMPYTVDEYKVMQANGDFNGFKITYLLNKVSGSSCTNRPENTTFAGDTTTNLLSACGYASGYKNIWFSTVITADEFIASFQFNSNPNAAYLLSYAYQSGGGSTGMYLAELSPVKGWDFAKDYVDKGAPTGFTATEASASDLTMSGNALTGVTAASSYVAPGTLPAQDTYISDTSALTETTVDISNPDNYTGGFIKFTGISKNKYVYFPHYKYFNYTLEEIGALGASGVITGVKVTYMYVGPTGQHGTTSTLMKQGGLVRYEVVTKVITPEQFASISMSDGKMMLIRTLNSGTAAGNFYLGDIEFITATAE